MRALLSVSDKTGFLDLALALAVRGCELVSTGGTAAALRSAGLMVTSVSDVTGVPEMMDGRVKTLHPRIHGGILARRNRPRDMAAVADHAIALIDIVVVNLYPFERAAANPAVSFDALVEEIDIGGPSLVRAAAKNFRDVLVVVAPADYATVVEELDRAGGPSPEFRFELARRAFEHTARYDRHIADTLHQFAMGEQGPMRDPRRGREALPAHLCLTLEKLRDLRYGENPHQQAGWYGPAAQTVGSLAILQGKELSFTNLLDLDAAARIVLEFDEPAAVVIKHTNPCGAATGTTAADAYVRAREADSLAAFGGIVGLNRPIDEATATAVTSTFIEAVIAPAVDPAALPILARRANMRVVVAPVDPLSRASRASPDAGREVRSILWGALVQRRDEVTEAHLRWPPDNEPDAGALRVVSKRQPGTAEWTALRFAWRICAHVKSNAVVFTTVDRTLAIGAGQMSRVDAVRLAVMKAGESGDGSGRLAGSVAASDAFFPFRDGLDAVAAAGATAVIQPGGSVRDNEVISAADEHGLAMVFTGRRHFKH